ncbi:hypothetical protein AU490_09235 [Lonsdalea populi]|nr:MULTISPECIES: hypothetical protein [Lonsdalea]OSM95648.1 hypothetical protein AU508_11220 [Lonsdalea populi]OSM98827.1 hypothetical protein AU499_12335 [Lonsdalea populi]QPQ24908.1 hypothetical protein I6N93_03660 [Lonsdalea populi]RAT17917.1 hypothetical protein AU486_03095 [Lonsdalea quercina]RAT28656.1 hypothetical protein AU490_09235 [Lonsdalea populi]
MRDISRFWIDQAGLLHPSISWRTANDFDLAGLSCWHALHPNVEAQAIRMATCPNAFDDVHIPHHPAVVESIQNLRADETEALLYLHTGLAKECKSAMLPSFIWLTGHYREVLGLAVDHPTPGWSELQLAAAMAQEHGGCWLVLDAMTRFTPRPGQALSHLLYLHFTSKAAIRDAGGWRWESAALPKEEHRSLTDWLSSPSEGDVLLDAMGDHPPIAMKINKIVGQTC